MEVYKTATALNFFSNKLVFTATFIVLLILSFLIFHEPSIQFFLTGIILFSVAYVLSFIPSVILLSVVACSLPLSVIVEDKFSGFSLIFPSEVLGGMLACAMVFKFITKKKQNRKFFLHPATIFLGSYILCSFISTIFSVSPLISSKAVFVKCVYVFAFYLASYDATIKKAHNVFLFFSTYIFSLLFVVVVALYKHSLLEFDKGKILLAVIPFFKDHTIYSVCIAFVIPILFGMLLSANKKHTFSILLLFLMLLVMFAGVFFSYSRAAMLSILILIPFLFFIKLKIKLRWLALVLIATGLSAWIYSDNIIFYLQQNRNNSNAKFADLETQAKSITSISADESNAERVNRWKCALRMFSEKPFTGFGPGTYQFEYFPFQRYYDLTRISVFSPYNITQQGRGGTAHSEFLLVLSECGIFAFIFFILVCSTVVLKGRKIYLNTKNRKKKLISLCVTCGLVSFLFHSMFNNFLDTDKAAFLFYSSIGVIVGLDLKKGNLP